MKSISKISKMITQYVWHSIKNRHSNVKYKNKQHEQTMDKSPINLKIYVLKYTNYNSEIFFPPMNKNLKDNNNAGEGMGSQHFSYSFV